MAPRAIQAELAFPALVARAGRRSKVQMVWVAQDLREPVVQAKAQRAEKVPAW